MRIHGCWRGPKIADNMLVLQRGTTERGMMRCYFVFVHGQLDWITAPSSEPDTSQPLGFYCWRYVLAKNEGDATKIAFKRVREHLDRSSRWLSNNHARLTLEADDVQTASITKLLKPDNRGFAFY